MKKHKKIAVFLLLIIIFVSAFAIKIVFPKTKQEDLTINQTISRLDNAKISLVKEIHSNSFDGIYFFHNIIYVNFSSDLLESKIKNIYKQYNVEEHQSFLYCLYKDKKNKEINYQIEISDGQFKRLYNKSVVESGYICGNEDYSEIRIKQNEIYYSLYSISLSGIDKDTLKNLNSEENINYSNNFLYFTENIYDNDGTLLYNLTSVYKNCK